MKEFFFKVRTFFYQLLLVDAIRLIVALIRYTFYGVILRRLKTINPGTNDIGTNTVHHNKTQLLKTVWALAVNRSRFLVYPLSAIRLSRNTPVLCIGPRAEGELLYLKGLGFKNVHGLDLISYSPWIDLGDMHNMPYKENAYGVAVVGWVLAYSDNRKKAAAEITRIVRNGGIVAIGSECVQRTREEISKRLGYKACDEKQLDSVQEILDLFEGHVDHVYFSQDKPKNPMEKYELLVLFSIKK